MVKSTAWVLGRCSWVAAVVLALGGVLSFSSAADSDAKPAGHTEKVTGTPRFCQADARGKFPGEGRNYCFPTAVSDSLVYLAGHGFPKLLPRGIADPAEAQIALIKELAGQDCMKTDPAAGTGAGQACAGVQRYVEASGYICKSIEYRGWRPMPKALAAYATGSWPPLDWIKEAAADGHSAAWVNIGWYVSGATPDEWKRVGGHWVAVVGWGVDGNGHEDAGVLLVDNPDVPVDENDSAKRRADRRRPADGTELPGNEEIAGDVMTTVRVSGGRLVGNYAGLPREAVGMYRVSGRGVHMAKKYDAAFLDGAVVLVIGDKLNSGDMAK